MLLPTIVTAISTCRLLAVADQVPDPSNAVLQKIPCEEPTHQQAHQDHLENGSDTCEENRCGQPRNWERALMIAWLFVCGESLHVSVCWCLCLLRLAGPRLTGSEPSHSAKLWLGTSALSARVCSVPCWSSSAVGSSTRGASHPVRCAEL